MIRSKSSAYCLALVALLLATSTCFANDADDIVYYTNYVRNQNGLSGVTTNSRLNAAALYHAQNMAAQYTMSHYLDGAGPGERLTAFGYRWSTYAENIAYNRGYDDPARTAMIVWLKSPGHRANILNSDVTEVGVAYATASDGTIFFCQIFGDR